MSMLNYNVYIIIFIGSSMTFIVSRFAYPFIDPIMIPFTKYFCIIG